MKAENRACNGKVQHTTTSIDKALIAKNLMQVTHQRIKALTEDIVHSYRCMTLNMSVKETKSFDKTIEKGEKIMIQ